MSKSKRRLVYEFYGGHCAICGCELKLDKGDARDIPIMTIDHIVPISEGGNNTLNNLQATCEKCNGTKADIVPKMDVVDMYFRKLK